jgi:pimeloyl-ACP methyl ester carboxylesterase
MKKALLFLLLLLAAFIVLPPIWFAVFPEPKPDLPPPGERVTVSPAQRVNVIEQGRGPAVVLIHGHPGCAYDWRPLMGELATRGFRVLAYDRVGYGYSDIRHNDDYTVDANAEELLGLLDAERLENATVVGWSYGGGVAIVAARKDPSRMSRLVLIGSVGPGIENRDGPPQLLVDFMAGPGFAWLGLVPPLSKRVRSVLTAEAFDPDQVSPHYLSQLNANFARPYTLWTFRHEGRDLDGKTADLDPKNVELPMLIVQGDGDRLVPSLVAEELHRRAPGSQLWMIEGAGHMLPITHPETLAERIAAFARP